MSVSGDAEWDKNTHRENAASAGRLVFADSTLALHTVAMHCDFVSNLHGEKIRTTLFWYFKLNHMKQEEDFKLILLTLKVMVLPNLEKLVKSNQ